MSYKSRRILQIFHSPEIYVSSVEKTNRPIQGGITTHNHAIEKIRQQQKQLSLRKFILCCDNCRRSPQEVLSSWNLIHLPFPAKKKLNLRRQAGSVVVAKTKPQQFRQEQRKCLFKSPNHNPGFLRNFSILTPYELKNFSSFVPIHC